MLKIFPRNVYVLQCFCTCISNERITYFTKKCWDLCKKNSMGRPLQHIVHGMNSAPQWSNTNKFRNKGHNSYSWLPWLLLWCKLSSFRFNGKEIRTLCEQSWLSICVGLVNLTTDTPRAHTWRLFTPEFMVMQIVLSVCIASTQASYPKLAVALRIFRVWNIALKIRLVFYYVKFKAIWTHWPHWPRI